MARELVLVERGRHLEAADVDAGAVGTADPDRIYAHTRHGSQLRNTTSDDGRSLRPRTHHTKYGKSPHRTIPKYIA
jgi:hypothetical protein